METDFVDFLNKASGSPYQATKECVRRLTDAGFIRIKEDQVWDLEKGKNYFFTRNNSSVFAFSVGQQYTFGNGFTIIGAHCDSPALQLKPNSSKISVNYLQLACETYGGGIWQTWFDRDLGISGKVVIKKGDNVEVKVVSIKKPLFNIPTLAIHLTEERYSNFKCNLETHMRAIVTANANSDSSPSYDINFVLFIYRTGHSPYILNLIANECGCQAEEIVGVDLRLCDVQPAAIVGIDKERICGQGIDNLNGTYCSLQSIINASKNLADEKNVRLVTIFDHEEVGSASFVGADSCLVRDLMKRILTSLKVSSCKGNEMLCKGQGLAITLRKSFCISVDNAHAVHPNYVNITEDAHRMHLNNGPVIKCNAKQRYASEVEGIYIVKSLAEKAQVPLQMFVVRQDTPCGSTIGPSTSKNTCIRTLDIGNCQLSMHSIRETCGCKDITYMTNLLTEYLEHFTNIPQPECM